MRTADTNIVVRYLTGGDPQQAARARAAIDAGCIVASTTVLLESQWVLRSVYGFVGNEVVAVLGAFAGLPGVRWKTPPYWQKSLPGR